MIQFKNITEVINRIQKSKLFTLKKMYLHDLNQDGNKDIILAFKNNNDLKSDDDKTLVAPVILLIHQGGDKYRFFHNEKIYPSIEGFFFKRIAFKDNFFTIELDTEVPGNYTAEKYITFKYSKNKLFYTDLEISPIGGMRESLLMFKQHKKTLEKFFLKIMILKK